MVSGGTLLVYVGVGSRRTAAVLGTVRVQSNLENRISLESPTIFSDLQTPWKDWNDRARHFALGESTDHNGDSALFAFIASADGTVERLQLTNGRPRTNSTSSSTPSNMVQEFFAGQPPLPQPSYSSNQGVATPWRATFNQGTPAHSPYVPSYASPSQMQYAPNQTSTPRPSYPSNQAESSLSYYSPDDFQAHHSYPPLGHASPPEHFPRSS